jgi:serine/threonine protein kinase
MMNLKVCDFGLCN